MRNVLLNLIAVLLVFSVQGCWAGEEKSDVFKEGKSMRSDPVDVPGPERGHKMSHRSNESSIDYERFRELFVGSHKPASKGYWEQGELVITDDTITWKGCDRVPFRIVKQQGDSFYIEILDGNSCLRHGMSIRHMRFSIISDGLFQENFELNLYESKQHLLENEFSTSGIMAR